MEPERYERAEWLKLFRNSICQELDLYIEDENPQNLVEICLKTIVEIWNEQVSEAANDSTLWDDSAAVVREVLPIEALSQLLTFLGKAGTFEDNFYRLASLTAPSLVELDLTGGILGHTSLSNKEALSFWQGLQSLKKLIFAEMEDFSGAPCKLLHSLACLKPQAPILSQLEALNLSGNEDLGDVTMKSLLRVLSGLQILNVSWCDALTDISIKAIACSPSQNSFRILNLEGLRRITYEGCNQLSDLPALKYISLKGCISAESFCIEGPSLEGLDLSLLQQLHGERIKSMLQPIASNLRVFRVGEGDVPPETLFEAFGEIPAPLALQELDVSWCEKLTAEAIASVVSKCPDLRVCLLRVTEADDSVIQTIAETCSKLEVLHLSRCSEITDVSLIPLAENCPLLRYLDLGWCAPSNSGAATIVQNCQSLRHLSFQGCKNVREDALSLIMEGACPFLRFLDLAWVNSASTEFAAEISRKRIRLSVVNYYCETFRNGKLIDDDF